MDIIEAIQARRSVRAFKPDPVPKEILKGILKSAVRAPSWENIQPWEFAILGGSKLEELRQALNEVRELPPHPDLPTPIFFPEPYNTRRRTLGKKVLAAKGIAREDKEKRRWWILQMMNFFNAPNAILLYIDRSIYKQDNFLNVYPLVDCGLVAMNIALLAVRYGLGTCLEVAPIIYPDVVKKVLGIPESKLLVLAIAIGYPDWDDPVNQIQTERESLEKIAKWYGFEE